MKVNILRQNGRFTPFILLLGFILAIFTFSALQMNGGEDTAVYIIQGQNMEQMAAAVQDVGGTVTHELGIINALVTALPLP